MRPTPPEDVTLAGILTAYSASSHRTGLEGDRRAGFTEAWCFHLALDVVLSLYQSSDARRSIFTLFYSAHTGEPAATLCFERPVFFHILPHRPAFCLRGGDMVEAAEGTIQLYTARRILAEIQHRVNGFNTYG